MNETNPETVQQLEGGSQWHCPEVECRYVESADLELVGPAKKAVWDSEDYVLQVVESDETIGVSNICNCCRSAKGWHPPWIQA